MIRSYTTNTSSTMQFTSVLSIKKVTAATQGGRKISWAVIVTVGDKEGTIGVAYSKACNISKAIAKAMEKAEKNAFKVDKIFPINFKHCASQIIINTKRKPYTKVSNYILQMCKALGEYRLSAKVIKGKNIMNNIMCFVEALKKMNYINGIIKTRKHYLKYNNGKT